MKLKYNRWEDHIGTYVWSISRSSWGKIISVRSCTLKCPICYTGRMVLTVEILDYGDISTNWWCWSMYDKEEKS